MGRRASRELAMKLLYQLEINKNNFGEQIVEFLNENNLNEKDRNYVSKIANGVFENLTEIDLLIGQNAKGWKLNRISKVDLSILRLSIYEMNNFDDVPSNVAINEAVEIAKKYSTVESSAFVNAILGKISRENKVQENITE